MWKSAKKYDIWIWNMDNNWSWSGFSWSVTECKICLWICIENAWIKHVSIILHSYIVGEALNWWQLQITVALVSNRKYANGRKQKITENRKRKWGSHFFSLYYYYFSFCAFFAVTFVLLSYTEFEARRKYRVHSIKCVIDSWFHFRFEIIFYLRFFAFLINIYIYRIESVQWNGSMYVVWKRLVFSFCFFSIPDCFNFSFVVPLERILFA